MNSVMPICTSRVSAPPVSAMRLVDRIIARLQKGPATRNEMAELFGVSRSVMAQRMNGMCAAKAYTIEASDWYEVMGGRDKTYRLVKVREVRGVGRAITVRSRGVAGRCGDEVRREGRAAARLRSELIKAGIYKDEMG